MRGRSRTARPSRGHRAGPRLVRSREIGSDFDLLLVSAVASLLAIRSFLALTGFPQVGGGGLHIAHMLWGGLLMLVSVLLLIGFVGRRLVSAAAIVSGIGFGTFIDEIGKFLTSDNDYFFRPAVAIIYVLFVLLYLGGRALAHRRHFSRVEHVAQAFDAARDLEVYGENPKHRAELLRFLRQHAEASPALAGLLHVIEDASPARPPNGRLARFRHGLRGRYRRVVAARWLRSAVVAVALAYLVLTILEVATIVTLQLNGRLPSGPAAGLVVIGGTVVSTTVTVGLGIAGVIRSRTSRSDAYRLFERAILVDLLLTDVFSFYATQFAALVSVVIDLALLTLLRDLSRAERSVGDADADPAPPAAVRT